jgi:hypothetical protein
VAGAQAARPGGVRAFVTKHWLRVALCLAAGAGVAGSISAAAWFALSDGPARSPQVVELVIPAGTAQRVAEGAAPPAIPRDLTFVQGDTLLVVNQDGARHRLGSLTVDAGSELRLPLETASSGTFLCTFHPQGSIGLIVKPRTNPLMLLWPTLLLGLPIGAVLAVVTHVLSRLDG